MTDVRVVGPDVDRAGEVLTPGALAFVGGLQRRSGALAEDFPDVLTLPAYELVRG